VLARVEDEVGVLPSLAIDLAGYRRQNKRVRADFVTATSYHTGLVMGLLCAVASAPVGCPTSHSPDAATGMTAGQRRPVMRGPINRGLINRAADRNGGRTSRG
jgi:hypothetical protein